MRFLLQPKIQMMNGIKSLINATGVLLLLLFCGIGCEPSNSGSNQTADPNEQAAMAEGGQKVEDIREPGPHSPSLSQSSQANQTDEVSESLSSQTKIETAGGSVAAADLASAETDSEHRDANSADENEPAEQQPEPLEPTIEIPVTWKRLGRNEIWVDFKNKNVILGGTICLTAGALEMFACPAGKKDHESIVAVNAKSSEMHAGLLAIGVEPGKTCQWQPDYVPASGSSIEIMVKWHDEEKNETVTRPAREMIMDFATKEPLTHQWVFGGSELYTDNETGENYYFADSGEMICVSNFATAALDLNVESTDANGGQQFAALTKNIPPLGTQVYLVLTPGEWIGPPKEKAPESPSTDSSKTEN